MAVITFPTDEAYNPHRHEMHCTLCENRIEFVPFVVWRGATDLFFCSNCCRMLAHGLIPDLIQAVAIRQLQELPGYQHVTLSRETWEELEQQRRQNKEKQEAEIWAAVRKAEKADEDLKK